MQNGNDDYNAKFVDDIDEQILNLLCEDGRMSYSEIAKRVGLSRPGVTERIASLQKRGVIERFTVSVPSKYFRKPLPVYFDLRFKPSEVRVAARKIADHPDIVTVNQMSARNSLHVHGFFNDIGEVGQFVDGFLVGLDGIVEIHTDFLMFRYKTGRV